MPRKHLLQLYDGIYDLDAGLDGSSLVDRYTRQYLKNILRTPGAYTGEDFDTSEDAATNFERMKVL